MKYVIILDSQPDVVHAFVETYDRAADYAEWLEEVWHIGSTLTPYNSDIHNITEETLDDFDVLIEMCK